MSRSKVKIFLKNNFNERQTFRLIFVVIFLILIHLVVYRRIFEASYIYAEPVPKLVFALVLSYLLLFLSSRIRSGRINGNMVSVYYGQRLFGILLFYYLIFSTIATLMQLGTTNAYSNMPIYLVTYFTVTSIFPIYLTLFSRIARISELKSNEVRVLAGLAMLPKLSKRYDYFAIFLLSIISFLLSHYIIGINSLILRVFLVFGAGILLLFIALITIKHLKVNSIAFIQAFVRVPSILYGNSCKKYFSTPTLFLYRNDFNENSKLILVKLTEIKLSDWIEQFEVESIIFSERQLINNFDSPSYNEILLVIGSDDREMNYHLNYVEMVVIDIKTKEKYYVTGNLQFSVYNLNGEVVISNMRFNNLIVLKVNKFMRSISTSNKKIYVKENLSYIKILYGYRFFLKQHTEHNKKNFFGGSKFYLHEGAYGTGKSLDDARFVNSLGMNPIPISLWEENYSNELLYIVYNRVQAIAKSINKTVENVTKYRDKKRNRILIPTVVLTTVVFAAFDNIIHKMAQFNKLRSVHEVTYKVLLDGLTSIGFSKTLVFHKEFIYLVVLFGAYFVSEKLVVSFMVYRNNSSELFQDYFISEIRKTVTKKNAVLIFEDIDRMEVPEVQKTFRLIANLNRSMYKENRIIGILSFDKNVLKKKYILQYGENGDAYLLDELDKIAIRFESLSFDKTDIFFKYLEEIINFFIKCSKLKVNTKKSEEIRQRFRKCLDRVDKEKLSFRNVRSLVPLLDFAIESNCSNESICAIESAIMSFNEDNNYIML